MQTTLASDRFRTASHSASRSATQIEVAVLCLLLFCLPALKAPAHICSALLILAFLIRGIRLRNFGQATPFEIPIWVLIGLGFVSAYTSDFASVPGVSERSMRFWLLDGLTAIVAGRLCYSAGQLRLIMAAVVCGGALAVGDSFLTWSAENSDYPELRSAGHVNQSALYMLNVLAVGLAALLAKATAVKAIGIIGVVTAFAFLVPSRSLVAMAAAIVLVLIGLTALLRHHNRPKAFASSALLIAVGFAALMATPPAAEFRHELTTRVTTGAYFGESDTLLSHRDSIFLTAIEVYDRHPFFGSGLRSFNLATAPEIVRAELEAEGRDFDAEAGKFYFFPYHGHNLWTTTLIERGLVGVITITVFLGLAFLAFLKPSFSGTGPTPEQKLPLLLGLLTVTSVTVAGLGQTTTYVEHGQAAILLMSVSWASYRALRKTGEA